MIVLYFTFFLFPEFQLQRFPEISNQNELGQTYSYDAQEKACSFTNIEEQTEWNEKVLVFSTYSHDYDVFQNSMELNQIHQRGPPQSLPELVAPKMGPDGRLRNADGTYAYMGGSKKGNPSSVKGWQDHHIISDSNPATMNHPLNDAAGYNLQGKFNKIKLPTEPSLHPTKSLHNGRHFQQVSDNLADQMDAIYFAGKANNWSQQQLRAELNKVVNAERALLKSGKRTLNSINRN